MANSFFAGVNEHGTSLTTFKDIFDQDAAIDPLRRAYLAERLPHGLIFAGAVGVGKATTARALAALFLCEKPKDAAPCGKCDACRLMSADPCSHPDYHVITKELIRYHDKTGKSKGIDLSIHVIRPELIDPAGRKPSMGRGKVFVIEQAELMNAAAQNAMLKTLEEPLGRTLIVLLTDQPHALLPTIRSRCQMVRFGALDPVNVMKELARRGFDKRDAQDAADFAEGSLGVAIRWLEDDVVAPARELSKMIEELSAGNPKPAGELPEWLKKAAEAYATKQLERDELGSKDAATREGYAVYLRLAGARLRRELAETEDPDVLERLCAGIDALARAEEYFDSNVTVSLVLQQLALTLERELAGGRAAAAKV
ncbi:MAG: hypothetical protein ACREIT_07525 [Tepidisphaeraceae bacterium]